MAKADIWMPIYIGDYLSDTMHLSAEQNGAYLLLLLYGWRNAGLIPSNDESLAQICRMPLELWKNNRPVIARFFQQGEYWTQKRQIEEIEKASNRRDAAKSNGIKGGRPKNNLQVSGGLTDGLAKPNPEKSSSSSSSSSDKNKNINAAKLFFDEARLLYLGDKRGLDSEWDNFRKKNPDYENILPILSVAIKKEIDHKEKLWKTPGAFCPPWKGFSVWINQKCWAQEFGNVIAAQKTSFNGAQFTPKAKVLQIL